MSKYLSAGLFFLVSLCSSCSVKLFSGRKHKKADTVTTNVQTDSTQAGVAITPIPPKDTSAPAETHTPPSTLPSAKLIEEVQPVWAKRIAYGTFSGKAKVSFDGPNGSNDFTANFRVKKDSVIWIQITVLGGAVSAARILVTQDSFFLVNYLQKEVTRIALKDAAKTLPTAVDFTQLQNLVVGDPLRDGNITDVMAQPTAWNITVEDTNYIQHLTFTKADSTMSAGQLSTRKPDGPTAQIDYSNYEMIDNRKVSAVRAVRVQNADKSFAIDMHFTNAQFDKELDFPFTIPKNYSVKNPHEKQ